MSSPRFYAKFLSTDVVNVTEIGKISGIDWRKFQGLPTNPNNLAAPPRIATIKPIKTPRLTNS
ncbi:hypothetical protein VB715_19745 [Crocosphaera sp. UHCC 0190]|uniref:hypothetical protein n=1 Tax=Crocosphaera sp. UHCC 0190 TaxID=3110246 RepID=UPI002B209D94|nr:hypothetical protein [Crocosphaera sp. UHCC 0190]MEA5512010.1 hypothetical protein [Crocosphaera sp. UHCC 0190]